MSIIHPRTNYGSSSNTASKNYVSSATSYKAPKAAVPANTGSYGWNVNGKNGGIQKQTNTKLIAGKTQAAPKAAVSGGSSRGSSSSGGWFGGSKSSSSNTASKS